MSRGWCEIGGAYYEEPWGMGSESQGEQTQREGFMGCAFLSIELYLLHFIMILVSVLPTSPQIPVLKPSSPCDDLEVGSGEVMRVGPQQGISVHG